jgi:hypothetical protein
MFSASRLATTPVRSHEGSKKGRGGFAQKAGTEPPTPVVDAVGGSEDVGGICSDVDDRGDGALLVLWSPAPASPSPGRRCASLSFAKMKVVSKNRRECSPPRL